MHALAAAFQEGVESLKVLRVEAVLIGVTCLTSPTLFLLVSTTLVNAAVFHVDEKNKFFRLSVA